MNDNDEIMQEFLVEAGELYELLNDQLIELENSPKDSDLLNAIFRAFHTIKGGAGFMKLTPMVEVCHRAEDVFGLLRNNEIEVSARLVDIMFQVLDVVGEMFELVRNEEQLQSPDPSLLQKLDGLLKPDAPMQGAAEQQASGTEAEQKDDEAPASMDDEFEQMRMAAINAADSTGQEQAKTKTVADGNNEDSGLITDDEFEQLLDDIHGKGKHTVLMQGAESKPVAEPVTQSASDLISDDEFEAVLDQLHGKNRGPGSITETPREVQPDTTSVKHRTENKTDGEAVKKPVVQKESSVRVDTERLDDIVNLVGELVLVRNRLSILKESVKHDQVQEAISTLELVTSDLQASVMKTRMQPIKKVFSRFPRVIRDLAKKLNKDINLELVGENTDLDKSLVEALADPLIHLVRNSADHGIESAQERFNAGKPGQGTITLSAQQEGDQILLTVADDGKGMDHNVFRRKAVESGLMSEEAANSLSDKEALNLIFAPGFSTKSEISDVSGRGVGMDVVQTRINELNGSIDIDSVPNEGTVITIRLPLTLAILPTLMVMLEKYQFALPLTNVHEAFNMEPDHINVVDGQEVMRIREQTLPLFYLTPWLVRNNHFEGPRANHKVIIVQMAGARFCLVVDRIVGQEEVVIKPLSRMLVNTPGFSGATITGDGNIALVLDLPSLMSNYSSNYAVY